MNEDDAASLGFSDGDISSADLSDVEELTAKKIEPCTPPELGDAPPLLSGYSQTYIVRKHDPSRDQGRNRQVLFRCGNWCYTGEVSFAGLGDGTAITLKDIPRAVPTLQRQQDRLKFFCCADRVPLDSVYRQPVEILAEAQEFVAQELASSRTSQELAKWSGAFRWVDDDTSASTYFELQADLPSCMKGIALVACKTYARGLVFITVYQAGSFYVVMQEGEGNQALLDVRFPDVSQHGQGLHLMTYSDRHRPWRKLTLWHALQTPATNDTRQPAGESSRRAGPSDRPQNTNLTSTSYLQTYVVMKPTGTVAFGSNNAYRDVLFRFGSWCYSGTVQLTPALTLADIPHVIPALRMQQSKLDFMCDVSQVPSKSPFAAPLENMQRLMPIMEEQVATSEEVLTDLLEKLSDMGLEDSVSSWFDGDSLQSFFEFQAAPTAVTKEAFRGVDLVASKSYSARGVVTIGIWFEDSYYVVLEEGGQEQPLLDSRFPNVSAKGRGYQIRAMAQGPEGWEELRKVSVWQTAAALQQEMDAKMVKAGMEEKRDENGAASEREEAADDDPGRKAVPLRLEQTSSADSAPDVESQLIVAAAGAGGEQTAAAPVGGRGGGIARVLLSPTGGGGSPLAQPKDSGGGDPVLCGSLKMDISGTDHAGSDAPEQGAGSKDAKRLRNASPDGEREGDMEAGSKNRWGASGVSTASPAASTSSAGLKAAAAPNHHAAAKALTNTKVALPHHVAPMVGLEDRLKKMRVDMHGEGDNAPWDTFGRPRTALLGAKAHK